MDSGSYMSTTALKISPQTSHLGFCVLSKTPINQQGKKKNILMSRQRKETHAIGWCSYDNVQYMWANPHPANFAVRCYKNPKLNVGETTP